MYAIMSCQPVILCCRSVILSPSLSSRTGSAKNLNPSIFVIPNPFGFAQGRLDLESILSP